MLTWLCFLLAAGDALPAGVVVVEAESFEHPGGWMLNQQAMDTMGSPYLLAHGMGVPVADAMTSVELPHAGAWRVWVRTRDWVAPWNAPGAPGRFQLLVNGTPLNTVFGTEGAAWHWQDGGVVQLGDTALRLGLHDLTGFEGRCDAILLSDDLDFVPPEDAAPRKYEHEAGHEEAGSFDLVVVGGGVAGTCAAITAARLGLHTALIQDRPVLGGNNSSEVRVHLNGEINLPPYPRLGDVVKVLDSGMRGNAMPAGNYDDARKLDVVRAQNGLSLFLNMHVGRVEKDGERIAAVDATDTTTGRERRFTGRFFADCTGDGTVGFLAGADYRVGREGRDETGESMAPPKGDKMTLGSSIQWYAEDTGAPAPFPECPWALPFNDETCQAVTKGDWDWEVGMHQDQVADIEQIRDHAFRAIYGNWAWLKNHHPDKERYANYALTWVAQIAGKRESRRLLGDVILRQQDIEERTAFPDACVTTTWSIDLHYPQPKNAEQFPGQEFRAICKQAKIEPYAIPYRCLYSRNVPNLFMAGRDISVTHVALGTVRVMRTGGMMGEVVGMAASVCAKENTTPRGVYAEHLDRLKAFMSRGAGWLDLATGTSIPPLP